MQRHSDLFLNLNRGFCYSCMSWVIWFMLEKRYIKNWSRVLEKPLKIRCTRGEHEKTILITSQSRHQNYRSMKFSQQLNLIALVKPDQDDWWEQNSFESDQIYSTSIHSASDLDSWRWNNLKVTKTRGLYGKILIGTWHGNSEQEQKYWFMF